MPIAGVLVGMDISQNGSYDLPVPSWVILIAALIWGGAWGTTYVRYRIWQQEEQNLRVRELNQEGRHGTGRD